MARSAPDPSTSPVSRVPVSLPPRPPLRLSGRLQAVLERATLAVGRLDGATDRILPPGVLAFLMVREEAVRSSQMAGSGATLRDLLLAEAGADPAAPVDQVVAVARHLAALVRGLGRVSDGAAVGGDLLAAVHAVLMGGEEGPDSLSGRLAVSLDGRDTPGRRDTGDRRDTRPDPDTRTPVPRDTGDTADGRDTRDGRGTRDTPDRRDTTDPAGPAPVSDLADLADPHALADLDAFLVRARGHGPALLTAALAYAHTQTVRPFARGNGRAGRMLMGLLLAEAGAVGRPVLGLSRELRQWQRQEEAGQLLGALEAPGGWEAWVEFCLGCVIAAATSAVQAAEAMAVLFARDRERIRAAVGRAEESALRVHAALQRRPVDGIPEVADRADLSYPTAARALETLADLAMVREVTGQQRNRVYAYEEVFTILGYGGER